MFHLNISHRIHQLAWGMILLLAVSLPISTALMNACATLIFFLYLASGDYQEKYRQIRQEPVVILWLIFFSWTLMSGWWSQADAPFIVHDLTKYKKLLLLPALIYFLKGRSLNHCVYAFLVGVVGAIIYAVVQGHGFVLSIQAREFLYTTHSLRNYITEGFFLAMALFAVIWFLRHRIHTTWMSALLLAIGVQILFNHGRMALLSTLLAVTLLIHWSVTKTRLKGVAVLGMLMGLGLLYVLSPLIQERMARTLLEASQLLSPATTDSIRIQYWYSSLQSWLTHPVMGLGPGGFRQMIINSGQTGEYIEHLHAHNEYIMVLLQYGLVGLSLFLAAVYQAIRQFSVRQASPSRVIAYAGILIFLLNCFTDAFLFNNTEGYTFVFLLAILLSPDQPESGHQPSIT